MVEDNDNFLFTVKFGVEDIADIKKSFAPVKDILDEIENGKIRFKFDNYQDVLNKLGKINDLDPEVKVQINYEAAMQQMAKDLKQQEELSLKIDSKDAIKQLNKLSVEFNKLYTKSSNGDIIDNKKLFDLASELKTINEQIEAFKGANITIPDLSPAVKKAKSALKELTDSNFFKDLGFGELNIGEIINKDQIRDIDNQILDLTEDIVELGSKMDVMRKMSKTPLVPQDSNVENITKHYLKLTSVLKDFDEIQSLVTGKFDKLTTVSKAETAIGKTLNELDEVLSRETPNNFDQDVLVTKALKQIQVLKDLGGEVEEWKTRLQNNFTEVLDFNEIQSRFDAFVKGIYGSINNIKRETQNVVSGGEIDSDKIHLIVDATQAQEVLDELRKPISTFLELDDDTARNQIKDLIAPFTNIHTVITSGESKIDNGNLEANVGQDLSNQFVLKGVEEAKAQLQELKDNYDNKEINQNYNLKGIDDAKLELSKINTGFTDNIEQKYSLYNTDDVLQDLKNINKFNDIPISQIYSLTGLATDRMDLNSLNDYDRTNITQTYNLNKIDANKERLSFLNAYNNTELAQIYTLAGLISERENVHDFNIKYDDKNIKENFIVEGIDKANTDLSQLIDQYNGSKIKLLADQNIRTQLQNLKETKDLEIPVELKIEDANITPSFSKIQDKINEYEPNIKVTPTVTKKDIQNNVVKKIKSSTQDSESKEGIGVVVTPNVTKKSIQDNVVKKIKAEALGKNGNGIKVKVEAQLPEDFKFDIEKFYVNTQALKDALDKDGAPVKVTVSKEQLYSELNKYSDNVVDVTLNATKLEVLKNGKSTVDVDADFKANQLQDDINKKDKDLTAKVNLEADDKIKFTTKEKLSLKGLIDIVDIDPNEVKKIKPVTLQAKLLPDDTVKVEQIPSIPATAKVDTQALQDDLNQHTYTITVKGAQNINSEDSNLDVLDEKVNQVTDSVNKKTQAFVDEGATVKDVVGSEVAELGNLEQITNNVTKSVKEETVGFARFTKTLSNIIAFELKNISKFKTTIDSINSSVNNLENKTGSKVKEITKSAQKNQNSQYGDVGKELRATISDFKKNKNYGSKDKDLLDDIIQKFRSLSKESNDFEDELQNIKNKLADLKDEIAKTKTSDATKFNENIIEQYKFLTKNAKEYYRILQLTTRLQPITPDEQALKEKFESFKSEIINNPSQYKIDESPNASKRSIEEAIKWTNKFKDSETNLANVIVKDLRKRIDELTAFLETADRESTQYYNEIEEKRNSLQKLIKEGFLKGSEDPQYVNDSDTVSFVAKDSSKNSDGIESIIYKTEALTIAIKELQDAKRSINTQSEDLVSIPQDAEVFNYIKSLTEFLKNNSRAANQDKEAIEDLIQKIRDLHKTGNLTKDTFDQLKSMGSDTISKVNISGRNGGSWLQTLLKQVRSRNASFLATYFGFQDIINYGRQIGETVIQINTAMTQLRKVSDQTTSELSESFEHASNTAKNLGLSITDVINATTSWNRMGYRGKEAEELARVSAIYQNVGDGISQEQAGNSLVSIIKGFNLEASDAINVVDKLNEVSNNFAVTSGGLGDALSRSSAALKASNTDLDKSLALITTMDEVLQNDETTGNVIKTMSMRIRGASSELEAIGEEVDSYVTSTSSLRDLVKSMTGFDIMKDKDTYKDIYDIVVGIGEKWEDLTDIQRASLGEALAGKRNANALFALLQNTDELQKVYETSINSTGSAMREQENYMLSMQAHVKELQAQAQKLAYDFIDSGLANKLIDFAASLLEKLDGIVSALNSVGGLLPTLGTTILGGYMTANKVIDYDQGFMLGGNYMTKNAQAKYMERNLVADMRKAFSTSNNPYGVFDDMIKNPLKQPKNFDIFERLVRDKAILEDGVDDTTKISKAINGIMNQDGDKIIAEINSYGDSMSILEGRAKGASIAFKGFGTAIGSALMNFGVSLAINALISGIYTLATASSTAAKNAKELNEQFQADTQQTQNWLDRTIELKEKLDNTNTSVQDAKTYRAELISIQEQLNNKIKAENGSWEENIDLLNSNIDAVKEYSKELKRNKFLEEETELNKENPSTWFSLPGRNTEAIKKKYFNAGKDISNLFKMYDSDILPYIKKELLSKVTSQYVDVNGKLDVDALNKLNAKDYISALNNIRTQLNQIKDGSGDFIGNYIDKAQEEIGQYSGYIHDFIDNIIVQDDVLDKKVDTLKEYAKNYQTAVSDNDTEKIEQYKKSAIYEYNEIVGSVLKNKNIDEKYKTTLLSQVKDYAGLLKDEINKQEFEVSFHTKFNDTDLTKSEAYLNLFNGFSGFDELQNALNGSIKLTDEQKISINSLKSDMDKYGLSLDDIARKLGVTGKLTGNYQNGLDDIVKKFTAISDNKIDTKELEMYLNTLTSDEFEKVASLVSSQQGVEKLNKLTKAHADLLGRTVPIWEDYKNAVTDAIGLVDELNKRQEKTILGITSSITKNVAPMIDQLSSMYDKLFNGDKGFDINQLDLSDFNSLVDMTSDENMTKLGVDEKSFDSIREKAENLINLANDGNTTSQQMKTAINELATEWVYGSGILDNVTEETKESTKALLKRENIINSDVVVESAYRANLEKEAHAWFGTVDALEAFENQDKETIEQKLKDAGVTDSATEAEKQLSAYKELATAKTEEERLKILDQIDATNGLVWTIESLRIEEFKYANQDLVPERKMQQLRDYGQLVAEVSKKLGNDLGNDYEKIAQADLEGLAHSTKGKSWSELTTTEQQELWDKAPDELKNTVNPKNDVKKAKIELNIDKKNEDKSKQEQTKQTFDWLQRALDKMNQTLEEIRKKGEAYGLSTREQIKNLQEINAELKKQDKLYNSNISAAQKRLEQLKYYKDANGNMQKLTEAEIRNAKLHPPVPITYTPYTISGQTSTIKGTRIAQASIDENGNISGGQLGNQNRKELNFAKTEGQSFTETYRIKDDTMANIIAQFMIDAVNNSNIGYDQSKRTTMYQALLKAGSVDKISEAVATDCSALVAAAINQTDIKGLSPYATSGSIEEFMASHPEIFEKYSYNPNNLKAGDIVWRKGHVAAVVGDNNTGFTVNKSTKIKGVKQTSFWQDLSSEEYNALSEYTQMQDKIEEMQNTQIDHNQEIVKNEAKIKELLLQQIDSDFKARETIFDSKQKQSADVENNKLSSLKLQTKELQKQEGYYKSLAKYAQKSADASLARFKNDTSGLSKNIIKRIKTGDFTQDDLYNQSDDVRVKVLAGIADWNQYLSYSEQALSYNSQKIETYLSSIEKHVEDLTHNFNEKINKWNGIIERYSTLVNNPFTSYSTKWGVDNLNIDLNKKELKEYKKEYKKIQDEVLKSDYFYYTDVNGKKKSFLQSQINGILDGTFTVDDMKNNKKYSEDMRKKVKAIGDTFGKQLQEISKNILETENQIAEARKQKFDTWMEYWKDRTETITNHFQNLITKSSLIIGASGYKDTTRAKAYTQNITEQKQLRAFRQLELKNEKKDLTYISKSINKRYLKEYERTGTIDLANVTDKGQFKKIQNYLSMQEKIQETQNAIDQSYVDIQKTIMEQLEFISTKYANIVAKVQDTLELLEQGSSYQESMGHIMSTKFPEMEMELNKQLADTTIQEVNELKAHFQEAINDGSIREGTQDYTDALSKIADAEKKHLEQLTALNEAEKKAREILERLFNLGDNEATLYINHRESLNNIIKNSMTGDKDSDTGRYADIAKNLGEEIGAYRAKIEQYSKKIDEWQTVFDNSNGMNTEEALAKINEYKEKKDEALVAISSKQKELQDLAKEELDLIRSYFDDLLAFEKNRLALIQKAEASEETLGHLPSAEFYKAEVDSNTKQLALIDDQKKAMIDSLQKNLDNGIIQKNSKEYKSAIKDIDNLELERVDLNNRNLELMIKQRNLAFEYFQFLKERMTDISSEADDWINLLTTTNKLVNKLEIDKNNYRDIAVFGTKFLSSAGDAVLGENYIKYQMGLERIKDIRAELNKVRKDLAIDKYDTTLIQREEELSRALNETAKSSADAKNAMVDLIKNGYDSALEAIKKIIDAYGQALDSEKSLHDYQQSISGDVKNISSLQKQILAYQNDTSESGRARLQKLQAQLKDNKKTLRNTQYDKYVSDQKETMNEMYEQLQEYGDKVIDDIRYGDGASFEKVQEYIKDNSEAIQDELNKQANHWGTEMSTNQKNIWDMQGQVKGVTEDIRKKTEDMINNLDRHALDVLSEINGFHTELDAHLDNNKDDIKNTIDNGFSIVERFYQWATIDLKEKLDNEASDISREITNALHMNPLTAKLDEGTFSTDVKFFHDAVEIFGKNIGTSWKDANTASTVNNQYADSPTVNDPVGQDLAEQYKRYIDARYDAGGARVKLGTIGYNYDKVIDYLNVHKDYAVQTFGSDYATEIKRANERALSDIEQFGTNRNPNNVNEAGEKYERGGYWRAVNEILPDLKKALKKKDYYNASLLDNDYHQILRMMETLNPLSEYLEDLKHKYATQITPLTGEKTTPEIGKIKGYATGVHNLKKDSISWTQERGSEAILRPTDGAVLTPLKKGDSVLTADATERLYNFAQDPLKFLHKFDMGNGATAITTNSGNVTTNTLSINVDKVMDYNDFIQKMQHDPKFEKMMQAMTTDRVFGGSSLKKFKY